MVVNISAARKKSMEAQKIMNLPIVLIAARIFIYLFWFIFIYLFNVEYKHEVSYAKGLDQNWSFKTIFKNTPIKKAIQKKNSDILNNQKQISISIFQNGKLKPFRHFFFSYGGDIFPESLPH